MSINFDVVLQTMPIRGKATYSLSDHSFDFLVDKQERLRIGSKGTTSLVVDTLQLEVSIDNAQCLYIWGYSPMGRWERAILSPPDASCGGLFVRHNAQLFAGVSIGLEETLVPRAYFDPNAGWFCMGQRNVHSNIQAVKFATGCIAVLANETIISLWVRPENLAEVIDCFQK